MSKRALITGIAGQDGSHLAEHLLAQGYQVWGLIRGQANPRWMRVNRLVTELAFVDGDLMDQASLVDEVDLVQPDELSYEADARQARVALCWTPTVAFGDLMAMMVESDLRQVSREREYGEALLAAKSQPCVSQVLGESSRWSPDCG